MTESSWFRCQEWGWAAACFDAEVPSADEALSEPRI